MKRTKTSIFSILGILAWHGPMSGYALSKALKASVGHFWSESFGQIYPTLSELEADRWIVERETPDDSPRARRVFAVTPKGHAALREWLAEEARPDKPRLEWLLKAMLSIEVGPELTLEHVQRTADRARRQLAGLDMAQRLVTSEEPLGGRREHAMLTILAGRFAAEARIKWAEAAKRLLTPLINSDKRPEKGEPHE